MIRRIKHLDIDRQKYQACLHQSDNYRIYAEDWYLDAHTDKCWDCLVYDDYIAVQPLPYVNKLRFKILFQPIYCQQLGIFSREILDGKIYKEFEDFFSKIPTLNYQFNSSNSELKNPLLISKNNQLLNLNFSYDELYCRFRKDRKRDIKKIEASSLKINDKICIDRFLKELNIKYPLFAKYFSKNWFVNLLNSIVSKGLYTYYELVDQDEIIATLFIIHSEKRRIILLVSRNQKNEHKGALAYLINYFIKKHAGQDLILDFEGSMIPSISDFNRSFGARSEVYPAIQFSKLDIIKKMFSF